METSINTPADENEIIETTNAPVDLNPKIETTAEIREIEIEFEVVNT